MDKEEVLVKMIKDRWMVNLENCSKLLSVLTDSQLEKELAPGKNRGIYVLGHIIAIHDQMLPLLDMGAPNHPELKALFIDEPDNVNTPFPETGSLRKLWKNQKADLIQKIESMKAVEWFNQHALVSNKNNDAELSENKLYILLTRTTHLAYHTGQLMMLK